MKTRRKLRPILNKTQYRAMMREYGTLQPCPLCGRWRYVFLPIRQFVASQWSSQETCDPYVGGQPP